mmetsp:Transcript_3717/g.11084  ORF Transcript_3717/g.11084 Transcript_3717/m.11084 type:complete len:508 (-) Transcript_3717:723-2246(-)|eukprot:CAMPEP_0198730424 /NCGR_PEP_ID=MMETSP1475-20131203/24551_1 /TAXON_ID= ORGANISM="Unidentified sp., Strain CCMP1999" /NCGR_SAMPLE_ID=MMETSP1475 /ASSEMBLY_ACC=CAM_ASM_001111 /LENGTH=507 /DNA_ID=CAMNT_0044493229 /DNA_START=293 /DNA_END=1816 /DNA_ORIENTATION=+
MNRSLLRALTGELPERIADYMEDGKALSIAFNRHGNILVSGTATGEIVLWDVETRSRARKLSGHEAAVPTVAVLAPFTGQYVVSGSLDCTLRFWEVLSGQCEVYRCEEKIIQVVASPVNQREVGFVPCGNYPRILVLASSKSGEGAGSDNHIVHLQIQDDEVLDPRKRQEFVIAYNKAGDRIIRGSPGGTLRYFDLSRGEGGQVVAQQSLKADLPIRAAVKEIVFAKDGTRLLVNSQDRYIRVYDAESLEVMASFTDPINRVQWRCAMFSGDGTYVLGGPVGEHKMHIWRLVDSQLERTLEGPKESIGGMLWHPRFPIVVSLGSYGGIYVWMKNQTENWSAFAPNFKVIDENEEYDEKEDEFDLSNPEVEKQRLADRLEAELSIHVDVVTVDTPDDSGSESIPPFYLPAVPEMPTAPIIPKGYFKPVVKRVKRKAHNEDSREHAKVACVKNEEAKPETSGQKAGSVQDADVDMQPISAVSAQKPTPARQAVDVGTKAVRATKPGSPT